MPKISSYGIVDTPLLTDKLIGTDVASTPPNQTKNFTVAQLGEALGMANVTITVTPAQMFDANLNPITLVEAPGEGKIIEPERVVIYFVYNSVAYNATADFTVRMGGIDYFIWDDGGATGGINATDNYVITLAPQYNPVVPTQQTLASGAFSPYPGNNPLTLAGTLLPTVGDTTFQVKVTYRILNVGTTI
jgi:hypothetical protein